MKTLEAFEQEYADKRAKLERELALAKLLPTNGKSITWNGEVGWDSKGGQQFGTQTLQIVPWLIHSDTAYKAARHVAYKAPHGMPGAGEGEHISSQFRAAFERQYALAVLESFRPQLIGINHVKGERYAGYFPEGFDYRAIPHYSDAEEIGSGQCEVSVSRSCSHHGTTGNLAFYVEIPEVGRVKVSVEVPGLHKLAPVAHGVKRYGGHGEVSSEKSWRVPSTPVAPAAVRSYGSGDHRNLHRTLHYLFHTIEEALECLGLLQKGEY